MKNTFSLIFISIALLLSITANASAETKIERATLGVSKIMIAVPEKWNKKVIIFAHGLRLKKEPLTATFRVDSPLSKSFLKQGWMLASTSYRRNGFVFQEGVSDIEQLRQHICTVYGAPTQVYVDGASMGGGIVTRIAEIGKGKYDGVLAVDPAFRLTMEYYNLTPQIPMLFLANQDETSAPMDYLRRFTGGLARPALWIVKRDGHCNVTDREEEAALRGLITYRESGKIEFEKDGTITPPPAVSVAQFRNGGASAAISSVDRGFGNIITAFVAVDLEKLGIQKGNKFSVSCKGKSVHPTYGITYSSVPVKEWVAFALADGTVEIARNYENAAATLGCNSEDRLFIQQMKKP